MQKLQYEFVDTLPSTSSDAHTVFDDVNKVEYVALQAHERRETATKDKKVKEGQEASVTTSTTEHVHAWLLLIPTASCDTSTSAPQFTLHRCTYYAVRS